MRLMADCVSTLAAFLYEYGTGHSAINGRIGAVRIYYLTMSAFYSTVSMAASALIFSPFAQAGFLIARYILINIIRVLLW